MSRMVGIKSFMRGSQALCLIRMARGQQHRGITAYISLRFVFRRDASIGGLQASIDDGLFFFAGFHTRSHHTVCPTLQSVAVNGAAGTFKTCPHRRFSLHRETAHWRKKDASRVWRA